MKRLTNLDRLLKILKDGQWHDADELACKVSHRFGHTIFVARQKGYPIEKRKVAHKDHQYRLES